MNLLMRVLILDFPALSPGWHYNLDVVTDIKVTSHFLQLDDIGCSIESKENCSTRIYVDRVTKGSRHN